jgi:hypothetical protein
MVLLCMTAAIVAALEQHQKGQTARQDASEKAPSGEPSLENPQVGSPISHFQLVEISKALRREAQGGQRHDRISDDFRLSTLLRGAAFYNPPPPAKPEPSTEYKALMARLHAEEEARQYERMLNPPPPTTQSFYERFPQARQYSSNKDDEDEVTFQDIDRQLALIINVLVSIVACSIAVWMAARHWRVEARLALSFGSSLLVAVAEVVVYNGYLRRVSEAKGKEKKKIEKKGVIDTWVIEPKPRDKKEPQMIGEVLGQDPKDSMRLRKGRIKT